MSPVAIPADRRFHRAHVKPSRRRGRAQAALWPVLKFGALLTLIVALAYEGFVLLANAQALRIEHILVRGNARMSAAQVQAVLGGLRGQNIVFTDLDEWRRQLVASPWVRDAAFKRTLPATVEVALTEREPLGLGRVRDRLFLVDERGNLIDEYGPQYGGLDLPIIDGLQPVSRDWQGPVMDPRGELAARVIQALRASPAIARRVSQVDVHDVHNAAVIVDDDPAVIYVGEDRFLPRLESYLSLAATLRERVNAIDYVDLRVDDRVFVGPAKVKARVDAAPAAAPAPAPRAPRDTRRKKR